MRLKVTAHSPVNLLCILPCPHPYHPEDSCPCAVHQDTGFRNKFNDTSTGEVGDLHLYCSSLPRASAVRSNGASSAAGGAPRAWGEAAASCASRCVAYTASSCALGGIFLHHSSCARPGVSVRNNSVSQGVVVGNCCVPVAQTSSVSQITPYHLPNNTTDRSDGRGQAARAGNKHARLEHGVQVAVEAVVRGGRVRALRAVQRHLALVEGQVLPRARLLPGVGRGQREGALVVAHRLQRAAQRVLAGACARRGEGVPD